MPRIHAATVEGITQPMAGSVLVWLQAPELAAASAPGQFVMVLCGPTYDPYLRFPLPIHRLTEQSIALLATAGSGVFPFLAGLPLGAVVDLYGPCGRALERFQTSDNVGLLAQGLRIGPLLPIIDRHEGPLQLLALVPTPGQLYPRELLPPTVEFSAFIGQDRIGPFWEAAGQLVLWSEHIFASGTSSFYRHLRNTVLRERLTVRQGFASAWLERDMACGAGACGSCLVITQRGPCRVCREGPFFDLLALVLE